MKRCGSCGAENGDGDNFCRSCGARLDSKESAGNLDRDLIDGFIDGSIFPKIIMVVIAAFVFLVVAVWAVSIFFGIPLESYTDGEKTAHQSEFNSLDINGDGALSYYEIQGYAPDFALDNSLDVFNDADKNHDGLLKGAEFDGYIYHLDKDYKDLEKQQKPKQQKTSSSSSKSNPMFEDEGHESCPVCGSEDLSEVNGGWYCNDCGEYLDDDEIYENWWDSQGIKCILPSLESNLHMI